MTVATSPNDSEIELATGRLRLLTSGEGPPLVILHHDIGNPGWLPLYEALAAHFHVYVPDLPGYGQSERPAWARHPRDLAIILQQLLNHLNLGRVTLVGLGFGGWLAAEMATMDQRNLSSLVLVAPFGIKPQEGEFADQIMMSHTDYVQLGFRNDEEFTRQFGAEPAADVSLGWDLNKEMTARIAWKPYMFSHQLPRLLKGVETPALVVWGRDDRIAPVECGEMYAAALPNARLEVLEETGHFAEMERPNQLAELITKHAAA
jgi:pimeloyl-ACP methyl ester carboxylesterase